MDALHQQTRPEVASSVRPTLRRNVVRRDKADTSAIGTRVPAPRCDASSDREVASAYDRRLGRGKTIVSVIPTKPVSAKPSTDKPATAKPSTAKGKYMKKVNLASTMSPGILLDETAFAK